MRLVFIGPDDMNLDTRNMNRLCFGALRESHIHNTFFAKGSGTHPSLGGDYIVWGQRKGNIYQANFSGPSGSVAVSVGSDSLNDAAWFSPFIGDKTGFVNGLGTLERMQLQQDTIDLSTQDRQLRQ